MLWPRCSKGPTFRGASVLRACVCVCMCVLSVCVCVCVRSPLNENGVVVVVADLDQLLLFVTDLDGS